MSQVIQIEKLEQAFEDILNQPELSGIKQLYDRKASLKYHARHLESAIKMLEDDLGRHSVSFQTATEALIDFAIKNVFPGLTGHKVLINVPTKNTFGDLQCNSAIRLSKVIHYFHFISAKDVKNSVSANDPQKIAKLIIEAVPSNDIIGKMEVAGPGFINIWVSKSFVIRELRKIVSIGAQPPRLSKTYTIAIDMSSPNIAKEMHVGHLRSTIIGESISRLLSFLGHRVLKINHIGDWGTQFGMLIAHLQELFPDSDRAPPIADLQAFYKTAKTRFDNEEDFKSRAYNAVVQLQCLDPKHIRAWEQICDISRKEFEKVYERLDIKDLVERGESFYQSRMHDLVRELEAQNLLTLDEGRKLLWAPGSEIPLTIVKSDGGLTYDTSDMAALLHRLHEEKADWVLYVVDAGQAVHFKTLFSAAELVGFYQPAVHRVEHVSFGVVLREDR
ncbi:hypothetical protein AHF37_02068 [Paragonimus kellicotti]|nr:hypothetical protein AHF37_02068 [Paragonimus kellicotti]